MQPSGRERASQQMEENLMGRIGESKKDRDSVKASESERTQKGERESGRAGERKSTCTRVDY